MKWLGILFLLLFVCNSYAKISGEISLDGRYYFDEGIYTNQDQEEVSIVLQPEYSYSIDQNRKGFRFIPFYRWNSLDEEKTHFDIRELVYYASSEKWEWKLGISKVFWGVTESQHLVDVINQTDFVENPDGEDKLGQPMLNITYVSEIGNWSAFLLPYFRERTFPGEDGRFRSSLVVDTENSVYTSKDEEKHIDMAFRWSHYIGDFDMALSWFHGTSRDPTFSINGSRLLPVYIQMEQFGLESQYIYGDWIFKLESIFRETELNTHFISSVIGLEYTFANLWKGMDIGFLTEYLYDDRRDETQSIFYDHLFIGNRWAFNDEKGTEILAGVFYNNDTARLTSFRLEGARRINENWKWSLEANLLFDLETTDLLYAYEKDDYIQLNLSYFY